MLSLNITETGEADMPEAVHIKLRSGGRDFTIVLMGPTLTTNFEAINALRAGSQFLADSCGVVLGDMKKASAADLLLPEKKEIN